MKREKRTWTVEEKQSILKEGEEQGAAQVCRKYGIYASLYYNWKEKFDHGFSTGKTCHHLPEKNDISLLRSI